MPGTRLELLKIQKRLVQRIKSEIDESIGPLSPALRKYRKEYEREFARFEISGMQELLENLLRSDVVFVADYHTSHYSQQTLVKILDDLVRHDKEIVLCVEMVQIKHQAALDAFMRGDICDDEFLERIDYEHTWGFKWGNYKPIFDFAREHGIRVAGINYAQETPSHSLEQRDRRAAEVVAAEALAAPKSVVVVHDGDLHIAKKHLPRDVADILGKTRSKMRCMRVFQNNESVYWRLAERERERTEVVRLRRDSFCVINTTPLVKYQSYLNWEANSEELNPFISSNWMISEQKSLNYSDQLQEIICTIAEFFGIPRDGLDDFQLYTTGDLDFFRILRHDKTYTEKEIQNITVQVLKGESYFITRKHIIYLGNISLSHAAEEATHFIDHQCSGDLEDALEAHQAFYYRVMREAVGWLGSKIINNKRKCYREVDFEKFLAESAGKKLPPKLAETRRISRYVCQHKKMECKLFRRRKSTNLKPTLKKIFRLPMNLHLGVTHALGYMLGDKFFYALAADEIGKNELKDLFYEDYSDPERPFEVYMHYTERMDRIAEKIYPHDAP